MSRNAAITQLSAKYSYLATWSAVSGFKRATWRFVVSLTFAQLYRKAGSMVVFDTDTSGTMPTQAPLEDAA